VGLVLVQADRSTTIGLIRIVSGLMVLYNCFCYSFDLMSYVSPKDAWLDGPATAIRREYSQISAPSDVFAPPFDPAGNNVLVSRGQISWSIFFHLEDPRAIWTAHIAIMIVMFLFTIGFASRITSVLTLMGALSYIWRAPTSIFGSTRSSWSCCSIW